MLITERNKINNILPNKRESNINESFTVDYSSIDNSLEHALLPYNDAYIMSKVYQKIKDNGKATIQGTFADQYIKLLFKPISTNTIIVEGTIGKTPINSTVIIMETNANPDLKSQLFLKNISSNYIINSIWNETFDQWGFQNLSSVLTPTKNTNNLGNKELIKQMIRNQKYSQLTLTYSPEEEHSFYRVKQNCTCTKELVKAKYISTTAEDPEYKDITVVNAEVSTDLHVTGTIDNKGKTLKIDYQIS